MAQIEKAVSNSSRGNDGRDASNALSVTESDLTARAKSQFPFLAALVSESDRFIKESVMGAENPIAVIADVAMNAETLSPSMRQAAVEAIDELRQIAGGRVHYSNPPSDLDISRLVNRTLCYLYSVRERSSESARTLFGFLISDVSF